MNDSQYQNKDPHKNDSSRGGTSPEPDSTPTAETTDSSKANKNDSPSIQQLKAFQAMADNSPRVQQFKAYQEMADNSPRVQQFKAYQEMADNSPRAQQFKAYQEMVDNSPRVQQFKAYQEMAEADVMGTKVVQTKGPNITEEKVIGRKISSNNAASVKIGTPLNYNLEQIGEELWSSDKELSYHWVVENDFGSLFIDEIYDKPIFSCSAVNPGNYKISVQVLNKGVPVTGMKYTYNQNVYMEKLNTELGGLSVGNFDFKFDGKKIEVSVKVQFEFEDTITEASQISFKHMFFNSISSKWGSHGRILEGTTDKGTTFNIPINISCKEVADNTYHKMVEVTKDKRRSKVIDEMNLDLGVDKTTIAHEFGHVLGLDDEYDGGWVENIMFWHDDGSNQLDEKALMNNGSEMRDRYFMLYKEAVGDTAPAGYTYKIK